MKLIPYLIFNGNCDAAFKFYEKNLGGKIESIMRYRDAPGCEQMPAATRDQIIHVRFVIGDQVLMASDSHPDQPFEGVKGCSISLQIETLAEAERVFAALSQGGTIKMPFEKTFWAAGFGMLVDQFGVPWMVNCEKAA